MSRIDAFNPASASLDTALHQGAAQDGGRAGVGSFGGQQVQVDTAESVLADAAEEISLHHSEKAESKHSSQRKKEAAHKQEVMSAEAILAYMDAAEGHEDPEQLVHLAKRILSRQNAPAGQAGQRGLREGGGAQQPARRAARGRQDDAGDEVRRVYRNPTQQILALQYVLQMGEREHAPEELLDELREELDELELAHGDAARADINTIEVAAQGGASAGEVLAFQDTYRDVVLGENSLAATLQLALARFGDGDFSAGLARLIQALGRDLAASRPSADPARLQNLVQDLYHLGVASTVLDGCRQLHERLQGDHGPLSATPVQLMQSLVGASAEKWISTSRFTALSGEVGAGAVQPQIQFLTGVKALMRDMPPKVFVDADQRQTVLQAVQDALDAAIDREDT